MSKTTAELIADLEGVDDYAIIDSHFKNVCKQSAKHLANQDDFIKAIRPLRNYWKMQWKGNREMAGEMSNTEVSSNLHGLANAYETVVGAIDERLKFLEFTEETKNGK